MTDDSTVSEQHNGRCREKSIALLESAKIQKYLFQWLKQLRDDYNWLLNQGIVKKTKTGLLLQNTSVRTKATANL